MPRHKKKFIDKKTAQTFQLVHRSQKDPLAADETAPQHVLLPICETGQAVDFKNNQHESSKEREERISKQREFGIPFDDDYDYFQHLKEADDDPAVLIPDNPEGDYIFESGKTKNSKTVAFDLPPEVFASEMEEDVGMLHRAIPPVGPQIDWDPDVVAALHEDFNYDDPENVLEDNFISVAAEGNNIDDDVDGDNCSVIDSCCSEYSCDSNSFENDFEEEETKSRFTNYSMSSSVLPRTKHFETLDDQFEKFYQKYDDENLGDIGHEDIDGNLPVDNITDSEMLTQLLGLSDEIFARTKEFDDKLPKEFYKDIVVQAEDNSDAEQNDDDLVVMEKVEPEQKWDCESIISTYSNIYNHPKLIDIPKPIKLSKKGIPLDTINPNKGLTAKVLKQLDRENEMLEIVDRIRNESETDYTEASVAITTRRKDESKEEKALRKQSVKQARKERRVEKKATKTAFSKEKLRQNKEMLNLQNNLSGVRIV